MKYARDQVDALRSATGRATYVRGHALIGEGDPHNRDASRATSSWLGVGLCSCGAMSAVLDSNNKRKAWHRQHKLAVLADDPTSDAASADV